MIRWDRKFVRRGRREKRKKLDRKEEEKRWKQLDRSAEARQMMSGKERKKEMRSR